MNLSIGIVGLPNVGKSTLFNSLLKKQVADVANYPFCTIEPNVGVIEVPNKYLIPLSQVVKTEKIVPAVVEFYDIAGLVKGASKGEGLGNKFLSHIRQVKAIIHVVRLFEDKSVVHTSSIINPSDDIKIINEELIFADLSTLSKQKEPKGKASKKDIRFFEVVQKIRKELDNGIPVNNQHLDDEEKELIAPLNLLTDKPVIYVFNLSENQLKSKEKTRKKIKQLTNDFANERIIINSYLSFCVKLENEAASLTLEERKILLSEYGMEEPGLNLLIKKAYQTLNLISFLTAGIKEVKAWTIEKGFKAPQAAGTIHSDFEKNFIKAEISSPSDFIRFGGWAKLREEGKIKLMGKEYVMEDNDVVDFKVGV